MKRHTLASKRKSLCMASSSATCVGLSDAAVKAIHDREDLKMCRPVQLFDLIFRVVGRL